MDNKSEGDMARIILCIHNVIVIDLIYLQSDVASEWQSLLSVQLSLQLPSFVAVSSSLLPQEILFGNTK